MNLFKHIICISASLVCVTIAQAKTIKKTFHKHVVLVSLTEGNTHGNYVTASTTDGHVISHTNMVGARDPLFVEYGLGKRLGLGLCMGGDIFKVTGQNYSGTTSLSPSSYDVIGNRPNMTVGMLKSTMSEVSLDLDYHYLIRRKWDLAAFVAYGSSNFTVQNTLAGGDGTMKYVAEGAILRFGSKARFYFGRHFGLVWMLSAFTTGCKPDAIHSNFGQIVQTGFGGYTSEFGLNFRFN